MASTSDNLNKKFAQIQFGIGTRMALYKKLMSFLKQGVPLMEVLIKFHELYARKKGDPRAVALNDWINAMKRGESFSQAIASWVPPSEVMLIEAGERSGSIVNSLQQAIEVTEAVKAMKKAIIGGLAYPAILLLVLVGMMVGFSVGIVPKLADVMDPSGWPGPAATLYDVSQFVNNYGIYVGATVVGLVVLMIKTFPYWVGATRKKVDGFPPWSVYRAFESSTFLVALSALMKTGTPLMEAIIRLKSLATPYVGWHLGRMAVRMKGGTANGVAMNTGFLDKETAADIEIYGEVADFQEAMEAIGKESIATGVERIQASTKAMGTVVMILVAFYTGWVYYAFFTLTSSLGQTPVT